jgi:hypothetical protein
MRLVALLLLAGYVVLGLVGHCTSAALPPEPTPAQLELIGRTHFNATVAVKRDDAPVYGERLVGALRRTGLFDRVELAEDLPGATLLASVDRRIYGTATIPCAALLSLGLVPSTTDEEWGEAFTLRSHSNSDRPVAIDFSYHGPTTLGFWAAVKNISPDFTAANPRETDRFTRAFAAAICSKAAGIQSLLR